MAVSEFKVPAASKPKVGTSSIGNEVPDYFGTTPEAPMGVARLPKLPGADPAIYQQFQDIDKLRATFDATTAPWYAAFQATTPKLADAYDQESGDINAIFSPFGYQAGMQDIRARRAAALKNLDAQLLGDLTRTLGLGRVGSGGTAGAGLNSFLARMAAAEAGKLRAAEATDAAAQERTDLSALMAARTGALGKRTTLTDALLQRLLQPQTVVGAQNTAVSNAIAQAIQNALLNSVVSVGGQMG